MILAWVVIKTLRDELLYLLYKPRLICSLEQVCLGLKERLEGPRELLVKYKFVHGQELIVHFPYDGNPVIQYTPDKGMPSSS